MVVAEYVPVQPPAVGSVMQAVTGVRSVCSCVQVEVEHLPASTMGSALAAV